MSRVSCLIRRCRKSLCVRHLQVRLLVTLAVAITVVILIGAMDNKTADDTTVRILPKRIIRKNGVKTILIWKPFLGDDILELESRCVQRCQAKCRVTDDKGEIQNADAVDFHLSNLWPKVWRIGTRETIKFPTYRRANQVWVLSNLEPPPHLWGDLSVFNGVFNWTRWYRTDATLLWPYGTANRLNSEETARETANLKTRNIYREKSKGFMGRISNCYDSGERYRIIKELRKHIDIDMYGTCYDNLCGNSTNQADASCDVIMKQYKFYLAFENDVCNDYVTEKYWWSLRRDQIPIVNWKSVNSIVPIPNSFINIYDFKTVKELADYLKQVSDDEELYNSYFKWKRYYADKGNCPACVLCKALHEQDKHAQVIENLDAWVRNDTCKKVGVSSTELTSYGQ